MQPYLKFLDKFMDFSFVTSHLKVESRVIDETRRQGWDIDSGVTLSCDVEIVSGVFRKSCEEILECFMIVERSLYKKTQ